MTDETLIPISVLASRFRKLRDHYRGLVSQCRWWEFKRKNIFSGAAAVYEAELQDLLSLGGSHALNKIGIKTSSIMQID